MTSTHKSTLRCATSLWSADLGNLRADMQRVDPYSDRFHIDVADGHYSPTLLFFPDQVAQLRPHTRKPLEVHFMATDPMLWVREFDQAGADIFIICNDAVPQPARVLEEIKARGKKAGVSLLLTEDISALEPLWPLLDIVTLMGTAAGIKGADMDPTQPERIRKLRAAVAKRGAKVEIEADGGIRRHTVPLIHQAGADLIVPGSLMFKEDPAQMTAWLRAL